MKWTCDNCKEEYDEPFLFDDKYCSEECREEATNGNGKSIQYDKENWTCDECGKQYQETFEFDDKYCSQYCRDIANK
jgi:predicted nucleic acid-binding Zn ribbon protein